MAPARSPRCATSTQIRTRPHETELGSYRSSHRLRPENFLRGNLLITFLGECPKLKVGSTGRCSTAEQASNGVSIEVQRRAVERVAETNGWELTWARR
jgi:hypothetical protein